MRAVSALPSAAARYACTRPPPWTSVGMRSWPPSWWARSSSTTSALVPATTDETTRCQPQAVSRRSRRAERRIRRPGAVAVSRRRGHASRSQRSAREGGHEMSGDPMRFDAVLFDNGGTLTHRTSPVAMVRALAARMGVDISEEDAARYWRRSREHSRSLMAEKRLRRNLSRAHHREAYVAGYAPFEEIAPGLAELMYDEWKTSPLTMVPYPDTPAVLKV